MRKLVPIFFLLFTQTMQSQIAGNALAFDGTDDYVSAPLPALFNDIGNNSFTIETWVKSSGQTASRILTAQADNMNFTSLLVSVARQIQFYVYTSGGNYSICSQDSITIGQWTHIAAIWDAGSSKPTIYINGVAAKPAAGLYQSSTGTDNAMALGSKTGGTQYFSGEMDELNIWNRPLPQCEVSLKLNRKLTGRENGLVLSYNFDEGTASGNNAADSLLPDHTTNAYNGLLHNFARSGAVSNWVASSAPIGFFDSAYLSVVHIGSTLSVNLSPATYQWIDCNSKQAIIGANLQTYSPPKAGSYAVVVVRGSCVDTSACINIYNSGVISANRSATVHVYPNPGHGIYTIAFGEVGQHKSFQVYNMIGELVLSKTDAKDKLISLDLSSFNNGIYILEVNDGGDISRTKVVKE